MFESVHVLCSSVDLKRKKVLSAEGSSKENSSEAGLDHKMMGILCALSARNEVSV